MKTIRLFHAGMAILACLVFTACKNANEAGRYIPRTAAFAMHLNGKALSDKLPWEEIRQNPLFRKASEDTTFPAALKKVLDDPSSAGIDITADMVMFAVKDSLGGYVSFQGKVKDAEKFNDFNVTMTENGATSESGDLKFISKYPVSVGWNKERFIYLIDAPQMKQIDDLTQRMQQDSITLPTTSGRDIGAGCKALFALASSATLAEENKFSSLLKEKGDVHMWLNAEEMNRAAINSSTLSMLNMDKFYKGSITTGTFEFGDGVITAKGHSYGSKELMDLFKKHGGGKVDEDMIRRIPAQQVVALVALNFKPQALQELVKLANMDGIVNMGMNGLGFNMDDFVKANKGDVLFTLSDFALPVPAVATDTSVNQPDAGKLQYNFMFAASIADKDAFNKIINAGKKLGQTPMLDSAGFPLQYGISGNYFVMSNRKETSDKFMSGAKGDFDFVSKVTGAPFGGYLNLQALLSGMNRATIKDSVAMRMFDASIKTWDRLYWTGGGFDDGGITQSAEIHFVDKKTNSLKQLNQYLANMGLMLQEQKEKQQRDYMQTPAMPDSLSEGN